MFAPTQRRRVHFSAPPAVIRRVLRSHLLPLHSGAPRAWFGGELPPGVVGLTLGSRMMLVARPPGRTIWSSRRTPTILGRVVPRPGGGSELRLAFYSSGFALRATKNPVAEAFFDDWLAGLESDVGAS